MANLILTTDCQRNCSYCFAKDSNNNLIQFNIENFDIAINWLIKDNPYLNRIGVLGGEPTMHPDFSDFIEYLLSRRLNTVVFTNGMIEDTTIYEKIIDIAHRNKVKSYNSFSFCLNMNENKYRSEKEKRLQDIFIKNLGRVTTLSFNIFEEEFDPRFLIYLIKENHMVPNIRLGLAAPLGNDNAYLNPETFYSVGKKLIDFCKETTKNDIIVGFDCGFVGCMFLDESVETLKKLKVDMFVHNCEPTIDVYPNLEVSCCYPTSRELKVKMEDWVSAISLYEYWAEELNKLPAIYDKCNNCKYYINSLCSGGCKAHKING